MRRRTVLLMFLAVALRSHAEVVGRIGSTPVTREEVLRNAAVHLQKLDEQRQRCVEQVDAERESALATSLRNVVRRRLLDLEAARRGVTADAVLASAQPIAVSDEDVRRFRESHARLFVPGAKEEEIAAAIHAHLANEAQAEAVDRLYAELEREHGARYLLDARRFDVAADGPADGRAGAPVTVIVFADFECPACAAVAPTLTRLRQQHGDAVRVVSRQFPLASHTNARRAAEAALCAARQGKYQAMHDALFRQERELNAGVLRELAIAAGADGARFDRCVAAHETAAEVDRDVAAALSAGVNGTPTIFVNGRLFNGSRYTDLSSLVREEQLRAAAR